MSFHDSQLLDHIRQGQNTEALEILKNTSDPGRLVDDWGKTLLHFAAKFGNNRITEYLIKSGTDINARDGQGKTALMLAAEHPDTIELLLRFNANIHISDNNGECALQLFSEKAQSKILKKLSEECAGDVEKIAAKLVDWKCSIYTSLGLKNARLTRLLLARDCPVDETSGGMLLKTTALTRAAYANDLENVKILLNHGVDVHAEGHRGITALSSFGLLRDNGNPEILRLLLARGVDPLQVIHNGSTQGGEMQMSRILKNRKVRTIRLLLERIVDLHAKDAHGCTALHYMARNKYPDVMKELRGKKYDVNARDNSGRTPLHFVEPTNFSNVKFLVDEAADVNAEDVHGITPLMTLWQKIRAYKRARVVDNRFRIKKDNAARGIELLLHRGADPQACTPITQEYPIFSIVEGEYGFSLLQPVLTHLAIIEARGTAIEQAIRDKINKHVLLRDYFAICARQIEEMKKTKVWKFISLNKLLIASRVKIEGYVGNKQLLLNLRRMKYENKYLPYYVYVVRNSVAEAVKIVRLRKIVATILCDAVGFCQTSHSTVINNITSYLNVRDLRRLHCEK